MSEENCNYDLSKFKLSKILNNNSNRKIIFLVGKFTNLDETKDAVVIFEKNPFEATILDGYFSADTELKLTFVNDIYSNLNCFPKSAVNGIKTTIIYPATAKHIEKYQIQEFHILEETPELYNNVILPHVTKEQFSLDWLYNILEHKKEADRIIYEDPCNERGFILLPDLKWDGKNIEALYCQALPRRRDIKSLRDLNETHLDLLENIRDKCCEILLNRYSVQKTQLRIYLHYHPTFFHMHVHFTFLKFEAPGIFCERSHLLDTIINNIQLVPDYYQKAKLSFTVRETDSLFDKLQESTQLVKRLKLPSNGVEHN